MNVDKRRMANRNSRDNMYLSSGILFLWIIYQFIGRRQVVSRNISGKGSGSYSNSYQVQNRNNSNTSIFTSNDHSNESHEVTRLHGNDESIQQKMRNSDYFKSNDFDFQPMMDEFEQVRILVTFTRVLMYRI